MGERSPLSTISGNFFGILYQIEYIFFSSLPEGNLRPLISICFAKQRYYGKYIDISVREKRV